MLLPGLLPLGVGHYLDDVPHFLRVAVQAVSSLDITVEGLLTLRSRRRLGCLAHATDHCLWVSLDRRLNWELD